MKTEQKDNPPQNLRRVVSYSPGISRNLSAVFGHLVLLPDWEAKPSESTDALFVWGGDNRPD